MTQQPGDRDASEGGAARRGGAARGANQRGPSQSGVLLGLGLDGDDGHKRLTRGQDFVLAGGSQETHAQMQETVIKVSERLRAKGKRIGEASPQELRDLLHDASS